MILKIVVVNVFIMSCSYLWADTYKVGALSWAPFTDTTREDGGISIRILRKVMESQGHAIEVIQMPWARSLVMLEKNQIDILPAVWYKKERSKTMIYSDAYAANRLVFIKPKGNDYEYTGAASLHGKVVGVVRGYAYDGKIVNNKNIKFSVSGTLERNVKKVVSGRIDLSLEDEMAAKEILDPELLKKIEFTKNALSVVPLYITCSKINPKCPLIIKAFNKGLLELGEKIDRKN